MSAPCRLNTVLLTSKADRSAFRLWAVGLTLSWLPLVLGLLARTRLALDGTWWGNLAGLAPIASVLRSYWFGMVPLSLVALSITGVLAFRGGRRNLLIASGFLSLMALMNLLEFFFLFTLQAEFATNVGTGMGISPGEIHPFQTGFVAILGDLAIKFISIAVLVFGRLPQETLSGGSK